jgi:hypothetical protein
MAAMTDKYLSFELFYEIWQDIGRRQTSIPEEINREY